MQSPATSLPPMRACVKMSESSDINSQFCAKCQALLSAEVDKTLVTASQTPDPPCESRRYRTANPLKNPPSEDCMLCFQSYNAFRSVNASEMSRGPVSRQSKHSAQNRTGIHDEAEYWVTQIDLQPGRQSFVLGSKWNEFFYTYAETLILFPQSHMEPLLNQGRIASSTRSDESKAIAKSWYDRCCNSHKGSCCPEDDEGKPLPHRLIDISSGTPRLLVVGENTPPLAYATMSHCWGSNVPLRLLSSNIASFQEKIEALPQSFEDALEILTWLGLSYIWIDSLCIIQDSNEDWERESATMADVYSNSSCNICACHAVDDTYGCFAERSAAALRPVKLRLDWGPKPGIYYGVNMSRWRDVHNSPLGMRSWTCQERHLAPRNLFFTSSQIFRGCCRCTASEDYPTGESKEMAWLSPRSLQMGRNMRRKADLFRHSGLPEEALVWEQFVRLYTSGHLTYEKDKLVAISGLASKMAPHLASDYLAGLWRKYLPEQLLWHLDHDERSIEICRHKEYIAPTWSWASLDGTIPQLSYRRSPNNGKLLLDIAEAKVELLNPSNLYGQVTGGFIKASGFLASHGIEVGPHKYYSLSVRDYHSIGIIRLDLPRKPMPNALYYLPVWYDEEATNGPKFQSHSNTALVRGLILEPAVPNSQTEFVRAGRFDLEYEKSAFQKKFREYTSKMLGKKEEDMQSSEWGDKFAITIF